jgi:hypothetical protein
VKFCECGCGQPAPIARWTNTAKGWVRGEAKRFRHGHNARGHGDFVKPVLEDRGYETPCHIWTGKLDEKGYAKSGTGYAYRRNWERIHGPVPSGLELDHLCRQRDCVNPDHLEPVTHAENMRRGSFGRASGVADPTGLRALRITRSWSQHDLARAVGVSNGLVSKWECGEHAILPKHQARLEALGWRQAA